MNCNVTFEQDNQKLIIEFFEDEQGYLTYKPHFDPPIDEKTQLGLLGLLCEKFIDSLHQNNDEQKD
jgi:hypothetical protein